MEPEQNTARCTAKTIRMSPRKARLVIDLIRGKQIRDAYATLKFTPKRASAPIYKALKSAVANAVGCKNMREEYLYVCEAYADDGPTMKRFRPRAKGSADKILKRTCHITIVVAEKE